MSTTFVSAVRANELRLCAVPRCCLPRYTISRFCSGHDGRFRRYGHPQGSPLDSKLWTLQRREVSALFEKNTAHRGQLQAVAWIGGLLAQASANEGAFKGAEEFNRLARHGVTSLMILTELCAVTLYLRSAPNAVRDDRAWDFACSAAIFKLAVRPRRFCRPAGSPWGVNVAPKKALSYALRPRESALKFIGAHLRQGLAPFLANVANAIETRDEQQRAFEAELSAPLAVL